MNINLKIKQQIVDLVKKQKVMIKIEDLVIPPSAEMGDWALPCFNLAKALKKSPVEVAQNIAMAIKPQGLVINVKAIGPYLNFIIDAYQVAESVIKEILIAKSKYGRNNIGKAQRVMIEYSQPNTHKEFHIGHLRNVCIGSALVNIYKNCGYKVIAANYPADSGAHVAKTLWYIQNYTNGKDVPALPEERGEFLGQCYARSVAELKDHPEFKTQVQEIMLKLEAGDKQLTKLWQETRQWSLNQFKQIYQEFGVRFDVYFFESIEEQNGKKLLPKLLKYDFIKKSDGAIIADLEKYDLGVLVLLRQDGTVLYGLKDLSLAQKKFKKFRIAKSIYLVDIRQSQYFKQIFKILELMGFKKDMVHVPYEFVQLKSGIISSRTGNIITYKEVKEAAVNKVLLETQKRHPDWPVKKINEVSFKIVLAALKFGLLKSGNNKVITFDLVEALDLNGFSGPYLQYTLARINSIFKKEVKNSVLKNKIDYRNLATPIEKELVRQLVDFPEIITAVIKTNDPSILTQYAYKLAKDFNTFYHELPVLKAQSPIRAARLTLLRAIRQVLANSLDLVGIPILEQM
jgi:arginyl-tRNA synthetase